MGNDGLLCGKKIDLEPARKFFCEAVKLAQVCGNRFSSDPPLSKVPVEQGECIKTLLCDEYDGIKLHKFFAKNETTLTFSTEGGCRGFIVHIGDVFIVCGEKHMRLPKDRHFFYISGEEEIHLNFLDDTYFYMVSIPA